MVAVRNGWLKRLAIPISPSVFGPNKTYRGLVLMPLLSTIGAYLTDTALRLLNSPHSILFQNWPVGLLGFCVGLLYILGELPNSFLKRRFHIPAGQIPAGIYGYFTIFFDFADSLLPVSFFYGIVYSWPLRWIIE
ncbi:hypothetical protein EBR96_01960, partial [bacterium]|nr:hypothetical protein [bacterium]